MTTKHPFSAPQDGKTPASPGVASNRNETTEELPTPLTGESSSEEPRQVATENDQKDGVPAPLSAPLTVGHQLDEAVCKALGISGWPHYYAEAPRDASKGVSWFGDDFRHVVQEAIDAVNSPSDWRFGSRVVEMTIYPRVSTMPASGYANAVLEKVARWPFSKRRAFTTALSNQCRIDALPGAAGGGLVAWPDALIHFREQMPEFICRAALEVAQPRDVRTDALPASAYKYADLRAGTLVSSNLVSYVYDPVDRWLKVEFKNGTAYKYAGVPEEVVNALIAAESAGKFFNAQIKNVYAAVKV